MPAAASRRDTDGAFEVRLHGELDLDRKDEMRDVVSAFRDSTASDVTVDLSDVTFMDSSGLASLILLVSTAEDRRGRVTLVAPNATVRRLLQVTALESQFDITS
jgi:anti-sigma B factor antagonist